MYNTLQRLNDMDKQELEVEQLINSQLCKEEFSQRQCSGVEEGLLNLLAEAHLTLIAWRRQQKQLNPQTTKPISLQVLCPKCNTGTLLLTSSTITEVTCSHCNEYSISN